MTAASDTPRRELDQRVDVETPEQVVISYSVAGVGSRGAAAVVDHLIVFGVLTLAWIALAMLAGAMPHGAPSAGMTTGAWALAVLLLMSFAALWGYFVYFEGAWDGQTPGKRLLHIRVVQDGGYSVSFAASAIRNLARIVDMQPAFLYGVGIVSVGLSSSGKRLGDMMAGTFVVQERVARATSPRAAPQAQAAPPPGQPASAPVAAALTAEEYDLLDRFLARASSLDADLRGKLVNQLMLRLRGALAGEDGPPMAQLRHLRERETAARARGISARGAVGAAREQQAIVALGTPAWQAFARELAEVQRRGLRHLTEREVSSFVARYREAATDLARLTTASQGRDVDAVFYLSRLVGAGHNLLYRQRPLTGRAVARFLLVSVPRELRRSAAFILAAALCLFGPMAISYYTVVTNPAVAERLVPAGLIDRANEGVGRARNGDHTYVALKSFERPVMASGIIANNVQVTFGVFAFGITAGILTVLMLVMNGVSIGAALGLYATKGIFFQIGEFVLAHCVFELSAICIAGGGGLLIASALLAPGALTRREALVVRGRRAIRLIAASTMLLICAGTIEGLISPRTDIPVVVKVCIAIACAIALAAYISFGGRGPAQAGPAEEFGYSDERALISR